MKEDKIDVMKWKHSIRETGLVEWICDCGVGHPDMNSVRELEAEYPQGKGTWGIHGCCGHCSRDDFPGKLKERTVVNISNEGNA